MQKVVKVTASTGEKEGKSIKTRRFAKGDWERRAKTSFNGRGSSRPAREKKKILSHERGTDLEAPRRLRGSRGVLERYREGIYE